MYGRRTLTRSSGGYIWDLAANGRIHFLDISPNGDILCDITTPWGELFHYEVFSSGECRLYIQTLNSPFIQHTYTIKVVSTNYSSKTADIQVLSCAFDDSLLQSGGLNQLSVTHDLPDTAQPSSVLNYNFSVTNNSSSSLSLRYILATNTGSWPRVYTTSSSDCSLPLPPIANTSKKCWYEDWLTNPPGCQVMTIGANLSNVPIVSGSIAMPGSGTEYFMLGIFIERTNYWGSGKHEWVMPAGHQGGRLYSITTSSCAGVTCEEGCFGNDLYDQTCNPSTGICEPNSTPKEVNSLKCMSTHVLDIGFKAYSWTRNTAFADALAYITDGTVDNVVSNWFLAQLEYQYLGVDTFLDGENVIIRIYLKELQTQSGTSSPNISYLNPIAFAPLIVLIGMILLACCAYPIYYALRDWYYKNILSIRTYTPAEVNKIIWGGGEFGDGIVKKQLEDCDTNFAGDAEGFKNCYKSVICGAADGSVDALGLPVSVDCIHLEVNQNIDACYAQYLIDDDLFKLKECMSKVKTDTGDELQKEADKKSESGGTGFLLAGILGLAMLGMMTTSKGGSATTIKVQAEKGTEKK